MEERNIKEENIVEVVDLLFDTIKSLQSISLFKFLKEQDLLRYLNGVTEEKNAYHSICPSYFNLKGKNLSYFPTQTEWELLRAALEVINKLYFLELPQKKSFGSKDKLQETYNQKEMLKEKLREALKNSSSKQDTEQEKNLYSDVLSLNNTIKKELELQSQKKLAADLNTKVDKKSEDNKDQENNGQGVKAQKEPQNIKTIRSSKDSLILKNIDPKNGPSKNEISIKKNSDRFHRSNTNNDTINSFRNRFALNREQSEQNTEKSDSKEALDKPVKFEEQLRKLIEAQDQLPTILEEASILEETSKQFLDASLKPKEELEKKPEKEEKPNNFSKASQTLILFKNISKSLTLFEGKLPELSEEPDKLSQFKKEFESTKKLIIKAKKDLRLYYLSQKTKIPLKVIQDLKKTHRQIFLENQDAIINFSKSNEINLEKLNPQILKYIIMNFKTIPTLLLSELQQHLKEIESLIVKGELNFTLLENPKVLDTEGLFLTELIYYSSSFLALKDKTAMKGPELFSKLIDLDFNLFGHILRYTTRNSSSNSFSIVDLINIASQKKYTNVLNIFLICEKNIMKMYQEHLDKEKILNKFDAENQGEKLAKYDDNVSKQTKEHLNQIKLESQNKNQDKKQKKSKLEFNLEHCLEWMKKNPRIAPLLSSYHNLETLSNFSHLILDPIAKEDISLNQLERMMENIHTIHRLIVLSGADNSINALKLVDQPGFLEIFDRASLKEAYQFHLEKKEQQLKKGRMMDHNEINFSNREKKAIPVPLKLKKDSFKPFPKQPEKIMALFKTQEETLRKIKLKNEKPKENELTNFEKIMPQKLALSNSLSITKRSLSLPKLRKASIEKISLKKPLEDNKTLEEPSNASKINTYKYLEYVKGILKTFSVFQKLSTNTDVKDRLENSFREKVVFERTKEKKTAERSAEHETYNEKNSISFGLSEDELNTNIEIQESIIQLCEESSEKDNLGETLGHLLDKLEALDKAQMSSTTLTRGTETSKESENSDKAATKKLSDKPREPTVPSIRLTKMINSHQFKEKFKNKLYANTDRTPPTDSKTSDTNSKNKP